MSAPINAPRKPVLDLPRGYVAFTRTPTFNPLTLPPGLRDSHRTSRGVWGEIVIEQGAVRYDWLDGSGESWDLEAGEVGVIPAGVPHRVKPMSEDTRFYLQLFHVDGVVEKDLKREENGRIALDLRPLPRPLRHQAIFSAFDALGPGDSLTFINDHDPGPLLGQFSVLRRRTLHRRMNNRPRYCGTSVGDSGAISKLRNKGCFPCFLRLEGRRHRYK